MRLNHLSLTQFRNYARLELTLHHRITVVQGVNAQGKTNLLEAVHLLATGRSPRASAEREMISWLALDGPLPYARLCAEIGEGKDAETLELIMELAPNGGSHGPAIRKQVRIDGAPKRALDLIGRLRVVLFLPEDVSLVVGGPAERRRYLDIALCQISPLYCRALSEYNKTLAQRNALLRRLRDVGGDPAQLGFWDTQMVEHGITVLHQRCQAVATLEELAASRHRDLSGGKEQLHLSYLPNPDPEVALDVASSVRRRRLSETRVTYQAVNVDAWRDVFVMQLRQVRNREVASGVCLIGPHRDDMVFSVDGRDARVFGSRGQQRTAALAVKLAEVELMRQMTGASPLLLLDDVMSELDMTRRHTLLDALSGIEQAIVTTTDWEDFSPTLLAQAHRLTVERGVLVERLVA